MHFRKFISTWALLALVIAQVAISQHNATHIDHSLEAYDIASHSSDADHKDQKSQKHECPQCLLTKSLQTAFYSSPAVLSFTVFSEATAFPKSHSAFIKISYNANSPRAPPAFLI